MCSGGAQRRVVLARRARSGSFVWSTGDGVHEQIYPHAKRGLVNRWRVTVSTRILPAVTKIALKAVENGQPIPDEDPESASCFAVVLVHLRKAGRKVVNDMIDRMRERHIH